MYKNVILNKFDNKGYIVYEYFNIYFQKYKVIYSISIQVVGCLQMVFL